MSKQSEFIEKIAPVIVAEAKARGYKFPSAIIAQACLESAWGKSKLASKYFNYFGLKCGRAWNGASVNLSTMEEYTAGTLKITADFRVYASMSAGVAGYFDFISTKRYSNLKNATTSLDYLQKIKADGYATSSYYVNNVFTLVTQYNLGKYDIVSDAVDVTATKDFETIVTEVIQGKWGNGNARKSALTKAGYDYTSIQAEVNKRIKGK